ncbi:LysR family transcriptional regulator [Marivita sp. S6314]|uniref:LysR family transcriptional regulator n=1 Tax=Marivita sp. S6314 TaxID=2926406 RepID=UPI001FF37D62|nr:LysR family transcriptional regulator [Marivita sp. S6314]MCK0150164.1 LysR family transcriptional regulator [Marivita sp. S6314]
MNKALHVPPELSGTCQNWGLLRSFYFIASERGVTRAAKALGLAQPSVSAALQRLEKQLGQTLVQRGQRTFELTAAGQVLFAEVEKMFDASLRAEEKLKALHSDLVGSVQLQVVTGARSGLFDEILRLMHQRHPSVLLEIQIASSHTIQHNVATGIVPFGVCLMMRPVARLGCDLLLSAKYGVFCGAEHPLFGRSDVSLNELRETPVISFSCDAEGRAPEPMIALRDDTGIGRTVSGTSGDFAEVCRMIIAGLGIGVLPVHAVTREVQDETLWHIDLPGIDLRADMYFVHDPARHLSAAEQTFLDVAKEVLGSSGPQLA